MIWRPTAFEPVNATKATVGVIDEMRADFFADSGKEGQHPRRHARLVEDLDQPQGDARRLLGRFEEHGIAGDECRGDHAGGYGERKVPR